MKQHSPGRRGAGRASVQWDCLAALASEEAEALIRDLPPALGQKARMVTVVFDTRPRAYHLSNGVEPDTMGLFEGDSLVEGEPGSPESPVRITLFLHVIDEEVGGAPRAFREEVRRTLLHELGHYLGLEETDLETRGLE